MHLPWCFTKIQFATTTRLNEELTADLTLGTSSSPICNVLSNFYSVFEQNFLLACWSVIRQTKQIMFYYLILLLSYTAYKNILSVSGLRQGETVGRVVWSSG